MFIVFLDYKMVRTCCVPNCQSTKKVPSHTFPKDAKRCKKWFENLYIKVLTEEKEIRKLRVCHKHFRDEDYSGSSTRRVLLHAAIPFIHMPSESVPSTSQIIDIIIPNFNIENITNEKDTTSKKITSKKFCCMNKTTRSLNLKKIRKY